MGPNISRLLERASEPLCLSEPSLAIDLVGVFGPPIIDLIDTLNRKNGFYVFHGALHVLPSHCLTASTDLERWNAETLWVGKYGELLRGYLFFAEEIGRASCRERV